MKVSDLLKAKGSGVTTIYPHNTVKEALTSLIENKVGSLVVIDSNLFPLGIITERDILRVVYQKEDANWYGASVEETMTKNIIIGVPDDDVEYIMSLMTTNRFRHVPILENNKLAGLISIGDIVKSQLKSMKTENRYLADYISGKYPT